MISSERTDLARERHAAIGEQDLGFADPAWIQDDVAGRGMARMVLIPETEIELAERNPAPFAAPADMDDLRLVRQQARELRAGSRREGFFHSGLELVQPGLDSKHGHVPLLCAGLSSRHIAKSEKTPSISATSLRFDSSITGVDRMGRRELPISRPARR